MGTRPLWGKSLMLLPGLAANFVHCDLLAEGPKRVVGGRSRQVGHSMPLPGAYLETVPQRPMSYAPRGRKVGERKPRALVRQLALAKSKSVLETITFPFNKQYFQTNRSSLRRLPTQPSSCIVSTRGQLGAIFRTILPLQTTSAGWELLRELR